jgi:hypothetical protein
VADRIYADDRSGCKHLNKSGLSKGAPAAQPAIDGFL